MAFEQHTLDELHKVQLDMMFEFDRICKKYNLSYVFTSGTALGAVRHNGFIPWDDDVDIGMMRDDYEKFLAVCSNELNEHFFLQTRETDPESPFLFARLRANNTTLLEDTLISQDMHHGIFIDVAPFDNIPDSQFMRSIHKWLLLVSQTARWLRTIHPNKKKASTSKYIVKLLIYRILRLIPANYLDKIEKRINTLFNSTTTECIGVIIGSTMYYDGATVPRDWIMPPIKMKFEGFYMNIPNKWHEYLKQSYNDYMTPPKIKEGSHHIKVIDPERPYKEYLVEIRKT